MTGWIFNVDKSLRYQPEYAVAINLDDFLKEFPSLRSLVCILLDELFHRFNPSIENINLLKPYPLQRLVMDESFKIQGPHPTYEEWYEMNFFSYKSLKHLYLNTISGTCLEFLSKLPNLTMLSCYYFDLSVQTWPEIENFKPPVIGSVTHFIVRRDDICLFVFHLLPKMFPQLQNFEMGHFPCADDHFFDESIDLQRVHLWNFRSLVSISLFIADGTFPVTLYSLKRLDSLKNLVIELYEMTVDHKRVLKMIDREDSILPAFKLELFRLEAHEPDSEFDSFYETELLPKVLLFETLDVCIISSYHKRKTVPKGLRDVVKSHTSLKYGLYGDQVLRYPDSNHEMISKHKWCRPRLHFSEV